MRTGLAIGLVVAATLSEASASPSMDITSSGSAGALVMDGENSSSTHVVKIADVTLSTAASNGLTVSISSGVLAKTDGRTPVHFQVLLVTHDASAPAPSAFTTPSATTYLWSSTVAGTVDQDLYIKYTPASLQDPGTYAAGVDLDVVDN